jgi:hypothetical protein
MPGDLPGVFPALRFRRREWRYRLSYLSDRREAAMRIDIHCHVIGNGKDISKVDEDVYLYADGKQLFFTRMLANLIEEDLIRMEAC